MLIVFTSCTCLPSWSWKRSRMIPKSLKGRDGRQIPCVETQFSPIYKREKKKTGQTLKSYKENDVMRRGEVTEEEEEDQDRRRRYLFRIK